MGLIYWGVIWWWLGPCKWPILYKLRGQINIVFNFNITFLQNWNRNFVHCSQLAHVNLNYCSARQKPCLWCWKCWECTSWLWIAECTECSNCDQIVSVLFLVKAPHYLTPFIFTIQIMLWETSHQGCGTKTALPRPISSPTYCITDHPRTVSNT